MLKPNRSALGYKWYWRGKHLSSFEREAAHDIMRLSSEEEAEILRKTINDHLNNYPEPSTDVESMRRVCLGDLDSAIRAIS